MRFHAEEADHRRNARYRFRLPAIVRNSVTALSQCAKARSDTPARERSPTTSAVGIAPTRPDSSLTSIRERADV